MQIVPFAGWARNAKLTCNDVEMVVTLDVGPRVISYGFAGSENLMAVNEKTAGQTGGDEFRSYGGHRLWIAPEQAPRTFQPDNTAVEYSREGDWHQFTSAPDQFHIQKQFRILADEARERFILVHRIYNHGAYPVTLGPWTPTQFRVDGECLFPQARFVPHSEKVLPARPLVLWHYTNMSDPRWRWGERVVRLKGMDRPPTKCGAFIEEGYVAYALNGHVHLRRFEARQGVEYPDFGCNFETFTRHDMLEVETLGPMQIVEQGSHVDHQETWYLIKGATPPEEDAACGDWLEELARSRPL